MSPSPGHGEAQSLVAAPAVSTAPTTEDAAGYLSCCPCPLRAPFPTPRTRWTCAVLPSPETLSARARKPLPVAGQGLADTSSWNPFLSASRWARWPAH